MPKTSDIAASFERRAQERDTIASVLPIERRDELAELLSDQDVETLRHLVNLGMGDNTLRALASNLAYLQAWSLAATGVSLPWPAPEALALKFVAHHLWDPVKRDSDPSHGMPDNVSELLRQQGFCARSARMRQMVLSQSFLLGKNVDTVDRSVQIHPAVTNLHISLINAP